MGLFDFIGATAAAGINAAASLAGLKKQYEYNKKLQKSAYNLT